MSKYTKERFASEAAARRGIRRKRTWKGRSELPHPYFCDGCKGWHVGSGEGGWN